MNADGWLKRLTEELPGWYVWTSSPGRWWYAVPAPSDAGEYRLRPGRIDAASPQELRILALLRYGWHDHCETCGVLARECGHRQPEREGR